MFARIAMMTGIRRRRPRAFAYRIASRDVRFASPRSTCPMWVVN